MLADGTEEEIPVPGRCDVPAGELLVKRSVLPQDYKENTIAIRSSLENVRIYIGGELRTVYDTENTRPFGKNSASRYVFCETSGEDAGKEEMCIRDSIMCGRYYVDDETAEEIEKVIRLERSGPSNSCRYTCLLYTSVSVPFFQRHQYSSRQDLLLPSLTLYRAKDGIVA